MKVLYFENACPRPSVISEEMVDHPKRRIKSEEIIQIWMIHSTYLNHPNFDDLRKL